jgi:chemotaxis protein methyltransferase CheR
MAATFGNAVPLTDDAYHLLNEYLEQTMGLHFPGHRRDLLEARLQPRLQELHLESFMDYCLRLATREREERALIAKAVTNNETYLFRETAQFDALFREALPELRKTLSVPGQLRILSAGCSSGEEVYTLRFWADGPHGDPELSVQIDGFDLDEDRVDIARRGACRRRSLREMSETQVARYLVPDGPERWLVRSEYRRGVEFRVGNIVNVASYRRALPYDVVFCRNVLIYFSETSLRRAIAGFLQVLRPGGLLFLGHSESVIGMFPELEAVRLGARIAYRRAA